MGSIVLNVLYFCFQILTRFYHARKASSTLQGRRSNRFVLVYFVGSDLHEQVILCCIFLHYFIDLYTQI